MSVTESFYDSNAKNPTFSISKRQYSSSYHSRKFNNAVKGLLINQFTQILRQDGKDLIVLDYCCGKGGDILKWTGAKVSHITFIDISSKSVEVCKERLDNRMFNNAKFYVVDVSKVPLYPILKNEANFNLVSCQFALHYGFESKKQAHVMLKNIADNLTPGGYFIATIPHPYEILKRLSKLKIFEGKSIFDGVEGTADDFTFGNNIYRISMDPSTVKDKFPNYGAKYDFWLDESVNCPEYLIHPELLSKICAKFGLELELPLTNFIDFMNSFIDHKNSEVRQETLDLLKRMSVFSQFLKDTEVNDEFEHIRSKLQSLPKDDRSIYGTIPKDDYELVSLYGVVAFKRK